MVTWVPVERSLLVGKVGDLRSKQVKDWTFDMCCFPG